jgi:hypothetical protein
MFAPTVTVQRLTSPPRNFLYSKQLFWFGSEPVDLKSIASFKADKVTEVAHHVTSWAAETGKGLLFYSEKGDKAAPHGAIHLVSQPKWISSTTFTMLTHHAGRCFGAHR